MERLLSLDDIGLVPAQLNLGRQEDKYDYSVKDPIDGTMSLPIFTSPMDSIVNESNWRIWQDSGIRPVLPRTTDIKVRLEGCEYIFAAFSLKEIQEHFLSFKRNSSRWFRICIDSGNGHDIEVFNVSRDLRKIYGNQVNIMVGNIGYPKTYIDCCNAGVDYVRVGMTTGSLVDEDKYGFYYPMASMLLDIKGLKNTSLTGIKHAKIIADGGISNQVEILKAMALGADAVMCGRQFARLVEAAGTMYVRTKTASGEEIDEPISASEVEKMSRSDLKDHKVRRLYVGNTTYEVQARRDGYDDVHDWTGKKKPCDARSELINVTGKLSSWLDETYDVFSYGFTMAGATKWDDFKTKINIARIQKWQ